MLRKFIISSSIISTLSISIPAWSKYLSNFNIGLQKTYSEHNDKIGVAFSGITASLYQNKNSIVFADTRLSYNKNTQGLHLGIGARHRFKSVQYGIYSFYDLYNTTSYLGQYVGGLEILYKNFQFRMNIYYPHSNISNMGMRGMEEELEIKIAQDHEVFISLKKYNFIDNNTHLKGYGGSIKYESKRQSRINFYTTIGYQYDNIYSKQAIVNFGIKIAAGSAQHLKRNHYKNIPSIQRNMFIYGYNPPSLLEKKMSQCHGDIIDKEKKIKALELEVEEEKKTEKKKEKTIGKKDSEIYKLKERVEQLEKKQVSLATQQEKLDQQLVIQKKESQGNLDKTKKQLQGEHKILKDDLDQQKKDIDSKIKTDLDKQKTELEGKIGADLGKQKKELQGNLDKTKKQLQGEHKILRDDLDQQKKDIDSKIKTDLDKQKTELEGKIGADLGKQKKELQGNLDKTKKQLQGEHKILKDDLDQQKKDIDSKIKTDLDKQKTELESKIKTYLGKQKTDLDKQVTGG